MSLFFSFLKQKYNITTYGRVHSRLSFFALVTGTFSLDGAIWHVSRVDGIVFLCLAVVMYLWAACYLVLIQAALRFISLQKPPEAEKPDTHQVQLGRYRWMYNRCLQRVIGSHAQEVI
jgi:vacuolar-type H+-ATPase subunit I/STV1